MGMTASFVAVSPRELEALRADAATAPDFFAERLGQQNAPGVIDIDKSWAAIHFMLTGEQWGGKPPESLPVLGGTEIGESMGYGPVRYLVPAEVKAASEVLEALPASQLKERFIPERLEEAEIYPAGIWLDEGLEGFDYIEHWYEQLRTFYRLAARDGSAVLLAIV